MGSVDIYIGKFYKIKNRPVKTVGWDSNTGKVGVTYPRSNRVYWVFPSTLQQY